MESFLKTVDWRDGVQEVPAGGYWECRHQEVVRKQMKNKSMIDPWAKARCSIVNFYSFYSLAGDKLLISSLIVDWRDRFWEVNTLEGVSRRTLGGWVMKGEPGRQERRCTLMGS